MVPSVGPGLTRGYDDDDEDDGIRPISIENFDTNQDDTPSKIAGADYGNGDGDGAKCSAFELPDFGILQSMGVYSRIPD